MKKLSLLLIAVMLLTGIFSTTAFAAIAPEEETVSPQQIMHCTRSFVAVSATKANVSVNAGSSAVSPFITSKITLQSAPLGTTTFTNVSSVDPEILTVEDAVAITHKCSFPITDSKEYRIKIELTDQVNGTTITKTYYQGLSR